MTEEILQASSLEKEFEVGDLVPHVNLLKTGEDLYENHSFYLVAQDKGSDIFVHTSIYTIKGNKTTGQYIADDARIPHVIFFKVPTKERGIMHDNDFVCGGWNPHQYLKSSDLKITTEGKHAIWQLGGLQFIDEPPHWHVKGNYLGADINLNMESYGPPHWAWGPWSELNTAGHAGMDIALKVTDGKISYAGDNYDLSNAFAVHEHVGATKQYDLIEMFTGKGKIASTQSIAPGQYWFWGHSEAVRFWYYTDPGGWSTGRVLLGNGETLTYDTTDLTIDEVDYWFDPRYSIYRPCKWHINMCSSKGILDVKVSTSGRCCEFYALRKGYIALYWFLGTWSGKFIYPDGHSVLLKDNLLMSTQMWTILHISL